MISATFVRKKILEGDWENLKELVPETTYAYLLSEEGKALREKLRNREKTDET